MKTTTFVIGAGASKEFNLPIGSELLDILAKELLPGATARRSSNEWSISRAYARNGGFRGGHVVSAHRLIGALAHALSIDRLLHQRRDEPDLVAMGKVCIAAAIILRESQSRLAGLGPTFFHGPDWDLREKEQDDSREVLYSLRDTWISRFMQHMAQPFGPGKIVEALKRSRFIVFNYDRCIEQYLYHALHYSWGLQAAEAAAAVNSLDIVHVYGGLGDLDLGAMHNGFGNKEANFIRASTEIRTFTEEKQSLQVERIRQMVVEAERLVFLGFGFDRLNCELLFGKRELPRSTSLWGTFLYSQEDADYRRQALYNLQETAGVSEIRVNELMENTTAGEYMRRKGPTLFADR